MKDFFNSIFKTTEERLKNPFIATFIISFLAINWKSISVFLFSEKAIEDRIIYIVTNYTSIWNSLLFPTIIAIFYIAALPYIMWFFDSVTKYSFKGRIKNMYKNKALQFDERITIAEKEVKLENAKANYREKADLNRQIENITDELELKNKQLADTQKQLNNYKMKESSQSNELNKLKNQHLKLIEDLRKAEESNEDLNKFINDSKKNYDQIYEDLKQIPDKTIKEFIEFIPKMNSNSIGIVNKRDYLNEYLNLGLIVESETIKRSNGRPAPSHYRVSQKGTDLIKMAYENRIM